MSIEINSVDQLSNNKWLNLFKAHYTDLSGKQREWLYASRKPLEDHGSEDKADAVIIVPFIESEKSNNAYFDLHGNNNYSLVLIKEYRIPIRDYEIGFPAGLIDDGEDIETTVRRELKEETNLDVKKILHIGPPVYSSAGMTDESTSFVFVLATGEPSAKNAHASEDIEVITMDNNDIATSQEIWHGKIGAKAYPILLIARHVGIEKLINI
jgi:ADP-ribose pyrophosphatase